MLYVSADCFINAHLLYLLFVSKLMDKEGTVRVSQKLFVIMLFARSKSDGPEALELNLRVHSDVTAVLGEFNVPCGV